jgi:hypothetical protein
MTDTTKKAMTLEDVRDCLRGKTYKSMEEAAANPMPSLNQMADAIDAHLSAQCNSSLIDVYDRLEKVEMDKEAALREGEAAAWRHNRTHCLYETKEDVPLADGDEWAEPLYTAPPPPRVEVTDEMVDHAMTAYDEFLGMDDEADYEAMRAALKVALSTGVFR